MPALSIRKQSLDCLQALGGFPLHPFLSLYPLRYTPEANPRMHALLPVPWCMEHRNASHLVRHYPSTTLHQPLNQLPQPSRHVQVLVTGAKGCNTITCITPSAIR
jgi:hypothetical protein